MGRARNKFPGKCRRCGGEVGAGDGWRVPGEDGDERWDTVHEVCPDAPSAGERRSEDRTAAAWAVPAQGLTPEGHRALGYTLHEGQTSSADAVPVNEAARRIARRTELGEALEAPRGVSGAAWLAVAELSGMVPASGRSADELDAAIGEHDIAAMRAELETAKDEILRRFEQVHVERAR